MRSPVRVLASAAALALALQLAGCASWKRSAYGQGADRDEWQQPDAVIALLDIGPGDRVADLGAGGGYFTFRLAEAVGDTGRVYAVDVDDDMLGLLAREVRERGAANVTVVRAEPDDPMLPDGEIDLVFVCDTYHHIADRPAYFRRVLADLAPNGRVAIVEYDERAGGFASAFGHFTPLETIEREMREAGYERIRNHEILTRQSFQIFRADDGTGE
jgi:ubiquinone/menaquinone biosynthesis C-methylase UbiE